MSNISSSLLFASWLFAGTLGAQATVFQGPAGGTGDLLVFAAPGSTHTRPAELQGIVLLPIDAVGRTEFTQFQAGQPRLKSDLPGASRLILPGSQGALYRYRRELVTGAEFGFFVVPSNAQARKLFSLPGTGPQGNDDPLPGAVGVAAQGDAFLVATTQAAGGDVYLVTLDGNAQNVTASLAPIEVLPQGLILLPSFGAALTARGPIRFLRGSGQTALVPLRPRTATAVLGQNQGAPPRAPRLTYWGDGMVASADGSTIAIVAGVTAAQAHVYTLRATGEPVCVNNLAAPIQGPGFSTGNGPNLALAPDGSRAAWKTLDALGGESFSRDVPTPLTPPETQITADANFTDTLNDTGVLSFFGRDSLVLVVGEPNGVGGIENADFYQAIFPFGGGALQLSNLTNTSGDVVAPFDEKGELETSDGIYQIPGEFGVVFHQAGSSGQGFVKRLDAVTGTVDVLRSEVDLLESIERAGAGFVLGILNDQASGRELLFVPFNHASGASSLSLLASGATFGATTGNAQGLYGSLIQMPGGLQLGRVQLPSTSSTYQYPTPLAYGPSLGFDPAGNLLATVTLGTSTYHFSWLASGKSAVYFAGGTPGMVLPAN